MCFFPAFYPLRFDLKQQWNSCHRVHTLFAVLRIILNFFPFVLYGDNIACFIQFICIPWQFFMFPVRSAFDFNSSFKFQWHWISVFRFMHRMESTWVWLCTECKTDTGHIYGMYMSICLVHICIFLHCSYLTSDRIGGSRLSAFISGVVCWQRKVVLRGRKNHFRGRKNYFSLPNITFCCQQTTRDINALGLVMRQFIQQTTVT